jgi:branched-chain amino acid transport system ATP-binding protein
MALLEIQNLTKTFAGIKAVFECSFSIEEGSISGLIGPNGAGKTTVFNLISGLIKPVSGQIYFDGKQIDGLQPHTITRMGISRTFQLTRDLKEMTVLENMVVQSPIRDLRELFIPGILKDEENRAMDLLEFVGIADLAKEQSKSLSFGQKKLMEFASVLMSQPRLVLLDEPAGGVNPSLLETIIKRIEELNREGMTFLIVEHNMDVVMKLCNPVVVMAYGNVLAQGTPDSVQNNPQVLDAYLGGGA